MQVKSAIFEASIIFTHLFLSKSSFYDRYVYAFV